MPPPKKAAKKAPAKSAPKHDDGKDLRRAREHAGRVEVLLASLGKSGGDVQTLVALAERELAGSHVKDAADLLRAAEHLCFGLLVSSQSDANARRALSESVEQELRHKLDKAQEHWEYTESLGEIYRKATERALEAFQAGAHCRALEFARAAEAIAHVHLHSEEGLVKRQHLLAV